MTTNWRQIPTHRVISQADLRRLAELKRLASEYKKLRDSIRDQWRNGIPVEAGPLDLEVKVHSQVRFTRGQLERLLEPRQLQRVLGEIQPTECMFLTVVDRFSDL